MELDGNRDTNAENLDIIYNSSSSEQISESSDSSDCEELLQGTGDNVENPIPFRPPFCLRKGQEFSDYKEFRLALIDAAIKDGFAVSFSKSEKARVAAECSGEGCKWRIYARKVQDGNKVVVVILEDHHTCSRLDFARNKLAQSVWVSGKILEMIREHPDYGVKMIQSYIKSVSHIDIKYMTAWRAKDRCLQQIHGSWSESYQKLPAYLDSLERSNPNSCVKLQLDADNRFKRLFISYKACIGGFIRGCRPLLFIDGTHVKRGYGGVILAAIGVDGNNNIFPLAFSVVESELKESWEWFFSHIRPLIVQHPQFNRLTIISDRMKGLDDSVASYFPEAIHGSCAWHLAQNIQKKFGMKIVKYHFWRIAKAFTNNEYEMYMEKLKVTSEAAVGWIKNNNPERWATSKFPGETYGHITSNIAEVFNSWIRSARNLPILAMLEDIRYLLMKKFYDSYHIAYTTDKCVTPAAYKILEEVGYISRSYTVRRASQFVFEVHDENNWGFRVDISDWTCTCLGWQVLRLPCSHASAAIHTAKIKSIYEYCDSYYYMDLYRHTYQDYIEPVLPQLPEGFAVSNDILPPVRRRKPGRPKVKRRRSEAPKEKRVMHCSLCKEAGHTKKSCNGSKD